MSAASKRCMRCDRFYTDKDEAEKKTGCYFHPGSFKNERLGFGWTCCRVNSLMDSRPSNPDAFDRHSRGCRWEPLHEEDRTVTAYLARFPAREKEGAEEGPAPDAVVPTAAEAKAKEAEAESAAAGVGEPTADEAKAPPQDDTPEHYVKYFIDNKTDTLAGIALRYNVPVAVLRKVNRIYSDVTLPAREFIYIPTDGQDCEVPMVRRDAPDDLVQRFCSETGGSREEAQYYLDSANGSLGLAVAEYQEDADWVTANPFLRECSKSFQLTKKPSAVRAEKKAAAAAKARAPPPRRPGLNINADDDDESSLLLGPRGSEVPLYPLEGVSETFVKRCVRCNGLFTDVDNKSPGCVCRYHPGKFEEKMADARDGINWGWSCCRSTGAVDHIMFNRVNPNSMIRTAPGCRTQPCHVEDMAFTAYMSQFPARDQPLAPPPLVAPSAPPATPPSAPRTPDVPPDENPDLMRVEVLFSDTLAGLALRCHSTVAELKRINRIVKDSEVSARRFIYAPRDPNRPAPEAPATPTQMPAERKFQQMTGASGEEARFYISHHNGDIEAAVREYHDDKLWEKENAGRTFIPPAIRKRK